MKKWIVLFVLLLAGCNFNKSQNYSTGNIQKSSSNVTTETKLNSINSTSGSKNNISPEEEKEIINLINDLLK